MTKRDWIVIALWIVMVISILLFMTVKVFAHHQGTTHRHHCGEETWKWHRHANWDLNTRRMHMSCGGLTVEEMEWVESRKGKESDCLGLARELGITTGYIPDVEHTSTPAGPSMINTPCEDDEEMPPEVKKPPVKKPPVYIPPIGDSPFQEQLDDASPTLPEDIEIPVVTEEPVVEMPEPCTEAYVERTFYKGFTLYTPTVLPEGVETLAGLWDTYWWLKDSGGALYVVIDSTWLVYRGRGDVGDLPVSALGAILVHQATNGTQAGLRGCPVDAPSQIELKSGLNMIGFPVVPDSIQRPSDMLSDNVHAVIVTTNGNFQSVFRAGDDGDDLLVDGQGLIALASEDAVISLDVPQAPAALRTLALSWGAIKQER